MKNKSLFTLLLVMCFSVCFAMTTDPTGKWTGYAGGPTGSMEVTYNFKIEGQKLTGTIEGPEGSLELQNGSYKDSVLNFDLPIMNKLLHQTGKYYGDSITVDFTVRTGPIHLRLVRNK